MKEFFKDIYPKILELKKNSKFRKCLNCDCYFGLLYSMKEELTKWEDQKYERMKDVSSIFDKRTEVKLHQCLGCDPCPPGEWTSELLKRKSRERKFYC
jgi:hypothetical protein